MDLPETRYADSGGVKIAYQVVGSGPIELVVVPGFVSNLDMQWTDPEITRFNQHLASFARVVMFDKAGTGLSDPVPAVPTLEQRMEDLRAVLDAAEVDRPYFLGISEGGPMSILFAATYPARVRGLILYGSFACGRMEVADNPGGPRWIDLCARIDTAVDNWGKGLLIDVFSPTMAGLPLARRINGMHERAMASPAMARAAFDAVVTTDVRDVLPAIGVPALVLHRIADAMPIEGARYIAEQIPQARFVELPGSDHYWWVGDTAPILNELEEFVTGQPARGRSDRVLATILFSDIVGSTQLASDLGDGAWKDLLERHNRVVREQFSAFRGREIVSTGDGFLATFDGPARAVRCGEAMVQAVKQLGLEVRIGIHTGECEVLQDNIGGIAVHIGARVAALAGPSETLVTSTVRDLVSGSGIEFEDAGTHELKGVAGTWFLHRAASVPTQSDSAREPVPVGSTPLVDEPPPMLQRAGIAIVRRAPGLSRRISSRVYQRIA
jgi:class 3 adenylate cyclase/pimeloyl-ACP methyl ester carboxylesterase